MHSCLNEMASACLAKGGRPLLRLSHAPIGYINRRCELVELTAS